ncbi:PQQ-binding-like beta-propeller repeat protein [Kitasatospora sp. NPDC059673]|uniref:outer membrane protein assembly factor BamB family protein n=1 Tax=Kitasatospora sp. NPDC059673 TaxID=3346901 RepID=UPI0036C056F0
MAIAVVAVVVVLGLLGVGGFVYFRHQGGDAAATRVREPGNTLTRDWEQSVPRTQPSGTGLTGLPGLWAVNQTVVFADGGGVRGFDGATGAPKWTLKPPDHVGRPCAMSWRATANGLGAVAYDAGGGDCSVIAAVDTNAGTVLWSKNLAGGVKSSTPILTANDNMITADLGQAGVTRFDARLGTTLPLPRPAPHSGECTKRYALADYHGVMTSDCPGEGVTVFSQLDTKGGNDSYPADGRKVLAVLGEDPVTVLFETDSEHRWIQTFTHEGAGKLIELTGELEKFHFDSRCRMVADKHLLIAEYQQTHGYAALDLNTGRLLWRTPAGKIYRLVDDISPDQVLFVTDGDTTGGVAGHQDLIAYDLKSDQPTVKGALTRPDGHSPGPAAGCEFVKAPGRLLTVCESSEQPGTNSIDSYGVYH